MPLIRDVIVGFFGLRPASPVAMAAVFTPFVRGGGRAKFPSGWECREDVVDTEGTGEATGFALALGGKLASLGDVFEAIMAVFKVEV
jgi:hypothetical protein